MTRICALLFAVALSLNCAHVQPVINTVVTCSGKTISPALVDEVYTDVMTENWTDLALTAVQALPEGWADVVCIYDALKTANPALVGHMQKLEAAHVELRAAVSLRCPTLEKLPVACDGSNCAAPPVAANAPPARPSALECDSHCGAPLSGLVTPTACLCQRKVDGKLRWVPLATVAAR